MKNYVSRERIDEISRQLNENIQKAIETINNIDAKIQNIISLSMLFDSYDNSIVSGSISYSKAKDPYTDIIYSFKSYQKFSISGTDNLRGSIKALRDELSVSTVSAEEMRVVVNEMSSTMDRIAFYMALIEYEMSDVKDDVVFKELLASAVSGLKNQKHNEFSYITKHVPILYDGKVNIHMDEWENHLNNKVSLTKSSIYEGKYLQYYNGDGKEIIAPLAVFKKENGKTVWTPMTDEQIQDFTTKVNTYHSDILRKKAFFSDKVKQAVDQHSVIFLVEFEKNSGIVANATAWSSPLGIVLQNKEGGWDPITTNSSTVIRTDMIKIYGYPYMQDTYAHEIGHVYAATTGIIHDIDSPSGELAEVMRQVESFDSSHTLLRNNAYKNTYEFFAECFAEYYSANDANVKGHNPNDLKAIEINYNGYNNLYDYIGSLVN